MKALLWPITISGKGVALKKFGKLYPTFDNDYYVQLDIRKYAHRSAVL